MSTRTFTLATILALSLAGCQTFGSNSAEDALFAGIAADKIAPINGGDTANNADGGSSVDAAALNAQSPEFLLAESEIRASTSNPTCAQFRKQRWQAQRTKSSLTAQDPSLMRLYPAAVLLHPKRRKRLN